MIVFRGVAIAVGGLILATATWAVVESAKLEGAHAALVWALALGTAVGACVAGRSRFLVGLVVALAVVAGEAYGMMMTAERVLSQREAQRAPMRAAERKLEAAKSAVKEAQSAVDGAPTMSPRLSEASRALEAARASIATKAAERGCLSNCQELLRAALTEAGREHEAALRELAEEKARRVGELERARAAVSRVEMPAVSGSALGERIGVESWKIDVLAAFLLTLGANGLAGVLIFWGVHVSEPRRPVSGVKKDDVVTGELIAVDVPKPVEPKSRELTLPAPPRPGDLVAFLEEGVDLDESGEGAVEEIVRAYKRWCMRRGVQPLPEATITMGLASFCEAGGLERVTRGGKDYLLGVVVREIRTGVARRRG